MYNRPDMPEAGIATVIFLATSVFTKQLSKENRMERDGRDDAVTDHVHCHIFGIYSWCKNRKRTIALGSFPLG